ncbi:hypothetical protein [Nocardiopsis chromatogenes]|uniref:hypothetical protein n=1 Tax=Nocardiopsis chromatogenes TaxID=280239 RepID=UPI001EF9E4AF|nr:hypothetical protein [Nocardiopsis chromatogenes]
MEGETHGSASGDSGSRDEASGSAQAGKPDAGTEEGGGSEGGRQSDRRTNARSSVGSNRGQAVQAGLIQGGVAFHTYVRSEETAERVRNALRMDEQKVETIVETFVECRDYKRFEEELRRSSIGIIVGEQGTGRGTAGINALAALRPGSPIQEEMPDLDERDAGLSGVEVEKEHTYLIDLTHAPEIGPTQRTALRSFAGRVREAETLLVVIATPKQWTEEFGEAYAWLEIEEPPRPLEVFFRSMRHRTCEEDARRWCDDEGVRAALRGADPGRATQLAGMAARGRPDTGGGGEDGYRQWIDSVIGSFTDPAKELRKWFAEHDYEKEFQRVLLEAVALLEGARCPVVLKQAHELAQRWKVPSAWRTPISGSGLSELLQDFPATVVDDRIRFTRQEIRDGALDHLWREHPHARADLLSWSESAAAELPWAERGDLADRWLRLGLRHSDPSPVTELMRSWGRTADLSWAAVPAIAEAAVTAEIGGVVRAELYRVAAGGRTHQLDRMVAEVCGVYGRVRPRSAMVRLRLIAAKVPHQWAGSLVGILESIADEPGNVESVLDELTTWVADASRHGHRGYFAVQGLAHLLTRSAQGPEDGEPVIFTELAESRVSADTVANCWQALMEDNAQASKTLWMWLNAFASWPVPEPVKESLRAAAHGSPGNAEAILRVIKRWRLACGRRVAEVDRLYEEISGRES